MGTIFTPILKTSGRFCSTFTESPNAFSLFFIRGFLLNNKIHKGRWNFKMLLWTFYPPKICPGKNKQIMIIMSMIIKYTQAIGPARFFLDNDQCLWQNFRLDHKIHNKTTTAIRILFYKLFVFNMDISLEQEIAGILAGKLTSMQKHIFIYTYLKMSMICSNSLVTSYCKPSGVEKQLLRKNNLETSLWIFTETFSASACDRLHFLYRSWKKMKKECLQDDRSKCYRSEENLFFVLTSEAEGQKALCVSLGLISAFLQRIVTISGFLDPTLAITLYFGRPNLHI